MTKLISPTFDLYLYDLRDGVGQDSQVIEQNRQRFLQKLPPSIDKKTFIQRDKDDQSFESEYIPLLGEQTQGYSKFLPNAIYNGYFYPVRLSDTYGLWLNCSFKEPQQLADLNWLSDLQTIVKDKLQGQAGKLGQTWIFSAQLPNVGVAEYASIANKCYEMMVPGADSAKKPEESVFLGVKLFEFWQYTPTKSSATSMEPDYFYKNHHIIIIFYPDKTLERKAANFYFHWIRLLMYRHKITWAYRQGCELTQRLKNQVSKINACQSEVDQASQQIDTSYLDLDAFQETLLEAWKILPRYTTELSQLDDQARTIEINLESYQRRLKHLSAKAGPLNLKNTKHRKRLGGKAGPMSLNKFIEKVQIKYLPQVKKDHENLAPNLKVLENLINYIQTMVAIEEERRERREEQRERHFHQKFAIWGIALAVGAIVASISGQIPALKILGCISTKWAQPITSLLWSLGAAGLAAFITSTIIKFRLKKKPRLNNKY